MRPFLSIVFCVSLLFFGETIQAQSNAQTVDPTWFESLSFRSVGPTRGGRVTAITGITDKPFTFFMGATGGGVWQTNDAGTTWHNISDGQIEAGSIGAIAVAPSKAQTIYVGTGSASPRGNVSAGIGMYKSSNGGKSWSSIGLEKVGQIGKIEVHPQNEHLLYVAALGQIFGPNPERGVYRSKDGGETWENILFVSDSTGAIDLAMNPHNPDEIYAAMWRAERKPWTLIDGGPDGGIWKTSDGGDHWEKLGGGLPTGILGKIGLAISPVNPERIWALVMAAHEEDCGLYRSDDSGTTWKRINRDHKLRQRAWYYSHLTAHPTDENTIFVCNVNFFKSIDGGLNFDEQIHVPHGDNHGLWINPNNPDIMLQCNDGGACVSLNGGETWSTQLNQPTSEFYRVTHDFGFPYRLYAGQQDNTTISVPSHDMPGITQTEHWYSVGGSECGDVGVGPDNNNTVWAGSYSGEITISNLATGQRRQVTAYPHYTEGTAQRDLKYRWQWNFPILVSQYDPDVVYHTGNVVFKSTNQGQTWERISPDLTRQLDEYHDIPGGPIQHDGTGVEIYSTIFAFEESPHQEGELWAGTDDGRLHITKDGGETWTEITPKGMPQEGTINKIELSPHEPGRAFVAVYHYRYNDFTPYIYKTTNYGQSWTKITNGIPNNHFVRAIGEDSDRKGLLYAGTEYGMYISFNDGNHWQPFQLNLPHVPVTDLEIHEKDLILSTQGRAFWILDDVSLLHELSDNLSKNENHFFAPRATYRTNVYGYRPKFHIYVAEDADLTKPYTLEVLDESGKQIRQYHSKATNPLHSLSLSPGLNEVSWDLRHQGPFLVDNLVTMVIRNPSPGPKAIPGNYTVKLTIDDWSRTVPLEIKPDPRWSDVTTEDYQAQLALGLEIRDIITNAHERIEQIRALRAQIQQKVKLLKDHAKQQEIKDQAMIIEMKLDQLEQKLIQNKSEVSQDNINYPRVFSNHIGRLYSVVVNADHRPTDGALERYEDLKMVDKQLRNAYKNFIDKEVNAFNELLQTQAVPHLIIPKVGEAQK